MNTLQSLQDKHKDKLCFVIGSGPSLHFQDLSKIHNYINITVNSSIIKFPDCDYFLSDDQDVRNWSYFHSEVKNSPCIKLLYEDKLKDTVHLFNEKEVILFKHKTWFSPKEKKYYDDGIKITKDFDKPIIGARTSMGSAVHFAYIMGCNPIVLLGCDCCYKNGKRYFWQFPDEKKPFRLDNKPILNLPSRKIGNQVTDFHGVEFKHYWDNLKKYNSSINIINCSDGILDCFDRMKLEEVIDKYG